MNFRQLNLEGIQCMQNPLRYAEINLMERRRIDYKCDCQERAKVINIFNRPLFNESGNVTW